MEATTQYFGKWFFINRSLNLIALLSFYARHLGVKITGPKCTQMHSAQCTQAMKARTPSPFVFRLFLTKLSLSYIRSALIVMIDLEDPLSWFNISLIGRVHIDARALLDI
jgi:hypothetical protein